MPSYFLTQSTTKHRLPATTREARLTTARAKPGLLSIQALSLSSQLLASYFLAGQLHWYTKQLGSASQSQRQNTNSKCGQQVRRVAGLWPDSQTAGHNTVVLLIVGCMSSCRPLRPMSTTWTQLWTSVHSRTQHRQVDFTQVLHRKSVISYLVVKFDSTIYGSY